MIYDMLISTCSTGKSIYITSNLKLMPTGGAR